MPKYACVYFWLLATLHIYSVNTNNAYLSCLQGAFSRLDPTGRFEEKMMEKMPVGRFGTVEEFSNLVAYMVSDYSSWLNGEVIQYDGGLLPSMSGMFSELSKVNREFHYKHNCIPKYISIRSYLTTRHDVLVFIGNKRRMGYVGAAY